MKSLSLLLFLFLTLPALGQPIMRHWVTTNQFNSTAVGSIITNQDANVRVLPSQITISNSASIFAGTIMDFWDPSGLNFNMQLIGQTGQIGVKNANLILDSGFGITLQGSGSYTGSGAGLKADTIKFTSLVQDIAGLLTNNVSISNALNNTGILLGTNGNVSASGTVSAGAFSTSGNGSILSTDPSGNSLTYTNGSIVLSNATTHWLVTATNGGITTTSNIVAASYYGDGSHLTGLGSGGTVAAGQNIDVNTNGTLYTVSANGLYFSSNTHSNCAAGTETTVWTNSPGIAANIMTNNSDCMVFTFIGTAGTTENHTFKFYLGTDTSLNVVKSFTGDYVLTIRVKRVSSSTYEGSIFGISPASGGIVFGAALASTHACDFTSNQGVGLTITSTTAAGAGLYTVEGVKKVGTGY